jgi:hypothetical protein
MNIVEITEIAILILEFWIFKELNRANPIPTIPKITSGIEIYELSSKIKYRIFTKNNDNVIPVKIYFNFLLLHNCTEEITATTAVTKKVTIHPNKFSVFMYAK